MTLIAAAIQAPSADNVHHVRFRIVARSLDLHVDDFFQACGPSHRRLLTLMSFGAVAENLRLALTTRGWTFQPQWFPDPADPTLLVRIEWDAIGAAQSADPLARFIATRHTNRRFFRGALSTADTDALAEAVTPIPGIKLEWFDTKRRRSALLRLIRIAETERFRSRELHRELFESIAFDAGWEEGSVERLAPATLEVERLVRSPFALLRHWPVMRAANLMGTHRVMGVRAGDLPARTSANLCAMTSTLMPDAAALAVGMGFQRVWLAAEGRGVALQPMVASAILATPAAASSGIRPRIHEVLREGWQELVGDALPLVVFRLGHAPRPRVVSKRKAVEHYLM